MELADSHCHLDDTQFDGERLAVVDRARQSGVRYMLTIGTGDGPPDLSAAIRVAETDEAIFATVGVHPNDAQKVDGGTFRHLEDLLTHRKVRALGEIGLDYHWGVPREAQIPVFLRQLAIAAERQMPVIIHTRDAWEETVELLAEHWAPAGVPGVMHCFTGDVAGAQRCLEMGIYLAFGGVTTFPKSTEIREAARITPPDRLLLETDAPYLAPVPRRGKRNEPAYLAYTAKALAELRGTPVDELARITTENFARLFLRDEASGGTGVRQLH